MTNLGEIEEAPFNLSISVPITDICVLGGRSDDAIFHTSKPLDSGCYLLVILAKEKYGS